MTPKDLKRGKETAIGKNGIGSKRVKKDEVIDTSMFQYYMISQFNKVARSSPIYCFC